MQETQVRSLGQEDPLEECMATHSSILVWEISWAEVPSRLQAWGHKYLEKTEYICMKPPFNNLFAFEYLSHSLFWRELNSTQPLFHAWSLSSLLYWTHLMIFLWLASFHDHQSPRRLLVHLSLIQLDTMVPTPSTASLKQSLIATHPKFLVSSTTSVVEWNATSWSLGSGIPSHCWRRQLRHPKFL